MKIHLIYGIVIGILLAVFSFHAYTVYILRDVVIKDSNTLAQVVQFLNQASQKQAPDQTSTPISTTK